MKVKFTIELIAKSNLNKTCFLSAWPRTKWSTVWHWSPGRRLGKPGGPLCWDCCLVEVGLFRGKPSSSAVVFLWDCGRHYPEVCARLTAGLTGDQYCAAWLYLGGRKTLVTERRLAGFNDWDDLIQRWDEPVVIAIYADDPLLWKRE